MKRLPKHLNTLYYEKYCHVPDTIQAAITTMGIKELILVPEDAEVVPADTNTLRAFLRDIGFIGDAFEYFDETRYHPGEQFYDFIQFMSSHPIIYLEPENGRFHFRN